MQGQHTESGIFIFIFPFRCSEISGVSYSILAITSHCRIPTAATLIGYPGLSFIVADPKRDFRACVGPYKTDC
jgi:hypothetical protein